jgi:hypothetical protein
VAVDSLNLHETFMHRWDALVSPRVLRALPIAKGFASGLKGPISLIWVEWTEGKRQGSLCG